MLAIHVHGLSCMQLLDDRQAFVRFPGQHLLVGVFAKVRELLVEPSKADADSYATVGQLIEAGKLFRHLPGTPARDRRDHGADYDTLGYCRNRPECYGGIG